MRFKDITGHSRAVGRLREMVDNNALPHAILLSGPSGIGKMRLARAFVQYLNCENRHDGDSCGLCPSCRRMEKFSNPDIHYVYPITRKRSTTPISEDFLPEWQRMLTDYPFMPPERWQQLIDAGNIQPTIYVSESERISETAALSSYADRFKVFLIWLPEKMQPAAANKLLKLIEEPHDDTLFVGVSNSPGEILPTILSRMQRVEMLRPTLEEIAAGMRKFGVSGEKADTLAPLARGSFQKALDLAQNDGEIGEFGDMFRSAMRAAYGRKGGQLRQLAETLAGYGRDKSIRFLDYFASMVRENFIANLKMPALNVMSREEREFSYKFAPFVNSANVEAIFNAVADAQRDISRNANARIVWFDFLLILTTLIRVGC